MRTEIPLNCFRNRITHTHTDILRTPAAFVFTGHLQTASTAIHHVLIRAPFASFPDPTLTSSARTGETNLFLRRAGLSLQIPRGMFRGWGGSDIQFPVIFININGIRSGIGKWLYHLHQSTWRRAESFESFPVEEGQSIRCVVPEPEEEHIGCAHGPAGRRRFYPR